MTAPCRDCGGPIVTSKSGYCRSCFPKHKWTPASRAKASASRKARWDRELADPIKRQEISDRAREANGRQVRTPELLAKQIAGRRRNHWCPPGYEGLSRTLKSKGYLAAERKEIILAQAAEDEKRRLASMTPLDRQLERLRAGATLVAKPDLRRPDHDFTLGGVASGAL